MVTRNEIEQFARRIGQASNAERVVLFGSHARGTPSEQSDVDLLVIAPSSLPRHKRPRELYKLLPSHPFPVDILVYTPDEIERGTRSSVSFVSTVLNEGKVLYVRRGTNREAVGGEVRQRPAQRRQ